MSSVISNDFPQMENGKQCLVRELADFHPNLWGDQFANHLVDDKVLGDVEQRMNGLKEKVKQELIISSTAMNPSMQLQLIGDIERLGIGYHFEKEIEEALTLIHGAHHDYEVNNQDDLYHVSLRFRLLRQQGFNVSCDIFKKYKDSRGNFIETLVEDKQGMLGLYEAAQMRKHGEDILDEALVFTTIRLRDAIQTSPGLQGNLPLGSLVKHALVYPIRKNIPRLEARYYLSVYDQVEWRNQAVSHLAKLDFNLLQTLHQHELQEITRWWKKLDFASKLPYGRDRIVELYFWVLGVCYEPKFSYARIVLTKAVAIVSYMDDTYDNRGTMEELRLFTKAVERVGNFIGGSGPYPVSGSVSGRVDTGTAIKMESRCNIGWNTDCMDQLPGYMKILYQAMLDLFNELEKDMVKQGMPFCAHYAKESMKRQARVYFVEAKWYFNKEVPTFEEYINNAMMSAGYILMGVTSVVGVKDLATREAVEWMFHIPKFLRASSMVARLLNDLVSHKFEQDRGHCASSIECYMTEHGVTEQEASDELRKLITNAWKDINESMLKPTNRDMPLALFKIGLNLATVVEVLYTEGDGYTHAGQDTKAHITSLLIDPIPIVEY